MALVPYQQTERRIQIPSLENPSEALQRHREALFDLDDDEIKDFQQDAQDSLAPNTVKAIQSTTSLFREFMKGKYPHVTDLSQAGYGHCLAWIKKLALTCSLTTVDVRFSHLKTHIVPSLALPEVMKDYKAPLAGIRKKLQAKRPAEVGKSPFMEDKLYEAVGLIAAATDFETQQRRLYLLWSFRTAARNSESRAARWCDVDIKPQGLIWHIPVSKGHVNQQKSLNSRDDEFCLIKQLQQWKAVCPEGNYIFRMISRTGKITQDPISRYILDYYIKVSALAVRMDPASVSTHSTRSGMISSSAEKGVPLTEVRKVSLHADLNSMTPYFRNGLDSFSHGL